jgi:hypothetical protein
MISERHSLADHLAMKLIDDNIDQNIDFHERQRMQLHVWSLAHAEFPQQSQETIKSFKSSMKNMWISTVNVCGLHFWARRFLFLQLSPPRNLAEDGLTRRQHSRQSTRYGSTIST